MWQGEYVAAQKGVHVFPIQSNDEVVRIRVVNRNRFNRHTKILAWFHFDWRTRTAIFWPFPFRWLLGRAMFDVAFVARSAQVPRRAFGRGARRGAAGIRGRSMASVWHRSSQPITKRISLPKPFTLRCADEASGH